MLKEAIEKIVSLAQVQHFEIEGKHYTTEGLYQVVPEKYRPRNIELTGLDSVCKLIRTERERLNTTIIIRVVSAKRVEVFTTYADDFSRDYLYTAVTDVPGIRTGYRDREVALIELRSLFVPNDGTNYLLDLLSRVSDGTSVATTDNGVTQTVEAKHGIALKERVQLKPRVELQPFRTFLEVEQPTSEFLLRINQNGDIGLFEADGGVWTLEAKSNIANYFRAQLSDLVDAGAVVVMM